MKMAVRLASVPIDTTTQGFTEEEAPSQHRKAIENTYGMACVMHLTPGMDEDIGLRFLVWCCTSVRFGFLNLDPSLALNIVPR